MAEEVVLANPVAALLHKPSARQQEAERLKGHDAALLPESARMYQPNSDLDPITFPDAVVATFLLTGGRKAEVLGLRVEDVSFDRKTVTLRPNPYRRLKTRTSHRVVPLWPQLDEILREHVFGRERPLELGFAHTSGDEDEMDQTAAIDPSEPEPIPPYNMDQARPDCSSPTWRSSCACCDLAARRTSRLGTGHASARERFAPSSVD